MSPDPAYEVGDELIYSKPWKLRGWRRAWARLRRRPTEGRKPARMVITNAVTSGRVPNFSLFTTCRLCGHAWSHHDPEDGRCHGQSLVSMGPCECGRDLAFMQRRLAGLARYSAAVPSDQENRDA